MTVAALTSSREYNGNGVTVNFAAPFRYLDPTHLQVTLIGADGSVTALVYGVDFTATPGSSDAGGTVTTTVAPAVGTRLRIKRVTPRGQSTDYTTGDDFPAGSHEAALDRAMLIDQEQDDKILDTAARALLVPDGETAAMIPAVATRAGKFLGFAAGPTAPPVALSGTGADGALRADLASAGLGTALVAQRGESVQSVLDRIVGQELTLAAFTAAMQARTWTVGEVIDAPIYGGSRWVCRASLILQNDFVAAPLDSSKVDFTGPLEVVVNLDGGGTGILDCDTASIRGYIRGEVARLRAQAAARFQRKLSLVSLGSVYCYGTSITYGQINPPIAAVPTGYGDGSAHVWTQAADPWPTIAISFSGQVYGAGKLAFVNRGFSGDRVGNAYRRHRTVPVGTSLISVIEFGTNDALYATNNGQYPEGLFQATPAATSNENGEYTFDKFAPALRRFAYREVLRGSFPILAAPYNWIAAAAYDGTTTAMGKIAAAFRRTHEEIAAEIGCGLIDLRDVVNSRDLATMTHDGIHLSATGRNTVAAGMVAAIAGIVEGAIEIAGPCETAFLAQDAPLNGLPTGGVGAGDLVLTENANTLGRAYTTAAAGADMVLAPGEMRYLAVRVLSDRMAVLPVARINNGGTLTINLDFGAAQGGAKVNTGRGAGLGPTAAPASTVAKVNGTGAGLTVNEPGTAPVLTVPPGWHLIGLGATAQASVVSGLSFDPRWGRWGAAVANAVNAAAAPTQAEFNALVGQFNALLARVRDGADGILP